MMLVGQRCVLRPLRVSDADSIVRHANNLNVAKHLRDRFPHPYTRHDARAFIAFASTFEHAGRNFAIDVAGEAVGTIGFTPGADVERFAAEIGYWLAEPYWGRGITTEAVVLLTDHLFSRLNMLRLFALPFAENVASARVLEKAGYQREALLRSSSVKYGQPRDQLLYARLNPAWTLDGPATGPVR